jgi:hypothetical protein
VSARRSPARRVGAATVVAGALGVAAAVLVSCGGSAKLIPVANSEPLQADFEEVARDAEAAHGSCAATEAALLKTAHDLAALPASVDAGLRRRLGEGLNRLRSDALELCAQPSTQTTQATTAPRSTTGATTQTSTTPAPQTNTQTTSTTAPSEGGGTPAKERETEEPPAKKEGNKGGGEGGAAGGAAPEGGAVK